MSWHSQVEDGAWPVLVTDTAVAEPRISVLADTYWCAREGVTKLDQGRITEEGTCSTFNEVARIILNDLIYPEPQASKVSTYGVCLSWFEKSERLPKDLTKPPEFGWWRRGPVSSGLVSMMYLDLDNHHDDKPMVPIEEVERLLREIGVPHLLYTSYSHASSRHKVRVIMPINRYATWVEAHRMFQVFNWILGGQFDGTIYDPGDYIYAPPHNGIRIDNSMPGGALALDVKAMLSFADQLERDHPQAFDQRKVAVRASVRPLTADEITKRQRLIADTQVQGAIGLANPSVFNSAWEHEIDTVPKGHRQTLMSLVSKCWVKSGGTLTFGDLQALQAEIDLRWGDYCRRKYGSGALRDDILSVMRLPVDPRPETMEQLVARQIARLKHKTHFKH